MSPAIDVFPWSAQRRRNVMVPPCQVDRARATELREAFALMYRHLPSDRRRACVARALRAVEQGCVAADEVLVVRGADGLQGMVVCSVGAGAAGQIWPPRARDVPEREQIEDALVRQALVAVRQRGAKFVQALVPPEELDAALALVRCGFRTATTLQVLRRSRPSPSPVPARRPPPGMRFLSFADAEGPIFARTMERTYEGTLDFPELSGVRTIEEVVAAQQARGIFDPTCWLLALEGDEPVGVVILTELPDWDEWELAYLGVVPEKRGRGIGRELVRRALAEAQARRAAQLSVAVDRRNEPAQRLYAAEGFVFQEEHFVYLFVPAADTV